MIYRRGIAAGVYEPPRQAQDVKAVKKRREEKVVKIDCRSSKEIRQQAAPEESRNACFRKSKLIRMREKKKECCKVLSRHQS